MIIYLGLSPLNTKQLKSFPFAEDTKEGMTILTRNTKEDADRSSQRVHVFSWKEDAANCLNPQGNVRTRFYQLYS